MDTMTPDQLFIVALFTQVVVAFVALMSYLSSRKNARKLDELHVSINGRLSELLKITAQAAHAQGVIVGAAATTTPQASGVTVVQSPEPSSPEFPA